MKCFLTCLIILIFCSSASAVDYFEQGKKAFYKSDYYTAQKLFLKELQNNSENYSCRYFLAHTYVYTGDIYKAKEEYNRIITFATVPTLQKLAVQSMYNLNHERIIQEDVENTNTKDNYFNLIRLGENYVKWNKFPINVYVAPGEYSNLVKSAFTTWQKASDNLVQFVFTGNVVNSQISVEFVDKLSIPYQEGFEAGHAAVKAKNNVIYKANIELLKVNPQSGQKLLSEVIYSTALHEIGHAVGIQGHSNNDNDLMSAKNALGKKSITTRDLNTLKMLYK